MTMNTYRPLRALAYTAFAAAMGLGLSSGQGTRVVDQHGTEFLMDVLPPTTQGKVNQARAIMKSGGGTGPLKVDKRNRYHISQNPTYSGSDEFGPSSGGDDLLLNQLLGVVLVPTPGDVRPSGWHGVEGVWHDFKNFPPEVGWALQNYLRKPVSLVSLDRMVKDVIVAYREGDRPVVDVLLPEQDITSGVVQLVVIESKLARIRVEGADVDTEEYIRSQMRVRKGEVIRQSEVLKDLAWLNRSPYRKVDLAYAPGGGFAETDIILKPYKTQTNSWFVGIEDSGTDFLGKERVVAGFNIGEFGNPTQSLAYQWSSDLDFEHVRAQSLVYSKDLPWRHNVTLLASFADIEGQIPIGGGNFLDSSGFNWGLSGRYNIPLSGKTAKLCPPLFGDFERRRDLALGFDHKSNESNLEFIGNFPTGVSGTRLFGNQVEIYQFTAAYKEVWQHPKGVSQLDLAGFWSPGGWTPHNSDAAFASSRAGSTADYMYGTASFEHQRRLIQDWSLRMKGIAQFSDSNLQASEQIGIGGYDRGRGFEPRIIRGDEGVFGMMELYAPEMSLARIFDWEYATGACQDQLRFLGFVEGGSTSNKDLLPNEVESQSVASVGLGMRWTYNDFFRLRVDYGKPVMTDNVQTDESGRFHIGATATF